MNSRTDPECDYVYKGIPNIIVLSKLNVVVLSGEMGVGKSNILQRYNILKIYWSDYVDITKEYSQEFLPR